MNNMWAQRYRNFLCWFIAEKWKINLLSDEERFPTQRKSDSKNDDV